MTPAESDFWQEILAPYRPGEIEAAFKSYLKAGMFFPKPAQILAFLAPSEQSYIDACAAETDAKERENRETRRKLEEAGEPAGLAQYHQLMKDAMERMQHIPDVSPARRTELTDKIAAWRKANQRGKRGDRN